MNTAVVEASMSSVGGPSGIVTLTEVIPKILDEFNPRLQTLGEVMTEIGTETVWVVDRLFAEGDSSILTAMPGVGKSWFAQQLAWCVATGRDFLGRKVKQGLVVYFAFEGHRQTARRLARLGLPLNHENFLMWQTGTDGSSPEKWLEKILEKRKPVLIILDCLQHIAQSREGNSYAEAYKLLGPLTQYAAKMKMHAHALHHSSAKEERSGVGAAIGSTGIPAAFGTVLQLRLMDKANDRGPRVLSCGNKHREGLMGTEDIPTVVLAAHPFSAELSVVGSYKDERVRHAGLEIISLLASAVSPVTRDALEKVAGVRQQTFENVLARLLKVGAVTRTPAGRKNQHLYTKGSTGESEWTTLFTDTGANAFNPPELPVESELVPTP